TNRSMPDNGPLVERMMQSMIHDRSHTSGSYVSERLGCAIAWVSLPEAFADCMPVWNEQRDVCLDFSGEDFTDQEELAKLRTRGHVFDPDKATYLIHLYEEYGIKFLEKLNGGFCGFLADLREMKLLLFNDRYGISRVYYHENDRGIFFASEAKALLKLLPELRRLDPASLG